MPQLDDMFSSLKKFQSSIVELIGQRINVIVLFVCLTTIILVPLKIIGRGYQPPDDALRHVAKVVSGKDWQDILVLKIGVTTDHHHGWHVFLGFFHDYLGWGTTGLLIFSVVLLLLLFMGSAFPWTKYPELWILSLLIISLTMGLIFRWALGRPFIISMAFTISLLFMWSYWGGKLIQPLKVVLLVVLYALVTHTHGSWYLFALPSLAFLLSGRIRLGLVFTGCWLLGSLLGTWFAGRPLPYLIEPVQTLISAVGDDVIEKQLAGEFRPSDGSLNVLMAFFAVFFASVYTKTFSKGQFREPAFILFALGWLLGFINIRFWADWGIPALLVCLYFMFEKIWDSHLKIRPVPRILMTLYVCTAFYFVTTNDYGQRWTSSLDKEYFTEEKAEQLGDWLPGKNGIVYNESMGLFYEMFYHFPQGNWKYVLGFEPGLMTPDNLEVFRCYKWNDRDVRALLPWVIKMKKEDRMLKFGPENSPPPITLLEWKYVATGVWMGRLPLEKGKK